MISYILTWVRKSGIKNILLPRVNRAKSLPSWSLADAVKLLQDSSIRFLPLLDLTFDAMRASKIAAWPRSSIPPGTTFNEPIPSCNTIFVIHQIIKSTESIGFSVFLHIMLRGHIYFWNMCDIKIIRIFGFSFK